MGNRGAPRREGPGFLAAGEVGRQITALAIAFGLAACGDNSEEPAVAGVVFEDLDSDGVFDPEERPLGGVTVYADLEDDGDLDAHDIAAVTDPSGAYRIALPISGPIAIRQKVPFGMTNVSGGEGPASLRPYIIGGADAGDGEYGFMAAVGFDLDGFFSQICGGALIAPRFVVTAGHCSEGAEPQNVRVMLGSTDLDAGQLHEVSAIFIHPLFNGDVTQGNDIAVWQLAEPVDFDAEPGLHTVELASQTTVDLAATGQLATTLGWGVSDNDSLLLQEVHVPIAGDDACAAGYPDVESFATQICAGVPEGGIDSCGGDSGGPLLVRDAGRDVWVHAGVTSWGEGCALPGKPGVYAETAALAAWVREIASEPSRVHRLEVTGSEVQADFGNVENLRPAVEAIDPRIGVTGLAPVDAPGGVIAAGAPLDLDFRVLGDEAGDLSCQLDADGPGPLEPAAVACDLGDNRVTHPGYPDGAFRADLLVDSGAQRLVRSTVVIAGTPSSDTAAGALTSGDQTDPDFNSTYFIDHYELTGIAPNVLTILELDIDFGGYIALYDADQRDASGGGTLQVELVTTGRGSLQFFTEPGKRYLLGISTLGESETGSYSVELINNGTLVQVTL